MKFNHPLMFNNINKDDFSKVIKFLKTNPILTQKKNVIKFENKWSKWLGVKYSVFVNSGSSANFITLAAMKSFLKKKEIITPPLTWPSDIMAVINNGFVPKFVDIKLETLSMDPELILKNISSKTAAVFITHAQGFNGLSEKLIKTLKRKKILLIEDVCESHGAKFKNKKLGNFGLISNFSFYYAHHMTTIEGGMICTNNKKIYEICRILRSHGMLRESNNKIYEKKLINKYNKLSPKFIFLYPTLNFRNTEIGATLGINQLKSLNSNNLRRTKNFNLFLKDLDGSKYYKNFDLKGSSNYAFPIILKTNNLKKRNYFERILAQKKIEFRRGNAGGGNQLRQPYIKKFINNVNFNNYKNVDHIHFFGYYIGNYPSLKKNSKSNSNTILIELEKKCKEKVGEFMSVV